MQLLYPQRVFHREKVFSISGNEKPQKGPISDGKGFRLVVVYENQAEVLPALLKDMLDKIILACKFGLEEVCYLNNRSSPLSFSQIITYGPEVILIFGDFSISRNMARLNKNSPYDLNGIKVLRAESLEKLEQMKAEKTVLWGSLQQMLGLK
jgi:DNA polymerase III psi subunit